MQKAEGRMQKAGGGRQLASISRQALQAWLDGLAGKQTLIAPREVAGVLLYRPVRNSREIAWGFSRPVMSVKEAFFPSTERLLTIQKTGQQIMLGEDLPEGRQVVFGVRPCEARGLRLLDALFLEAEPVDPYYARRRANTTLIGLACRELGPTCFCTSTGGAPDDPADVDVMIYETDGGYLVEAVSARGLSLIPDGEWPQTEEIHTPLATPEPPYAIPERSAWPKFFGEGEFWDRMAERCLSCRVCAYVCPTCRCFIVRDEALPEAGQFERIRCWDSCAGQNYRLVAGGHRPRSEKGERIRNRVFCKFLFYPEQYKLSEAACTGCGRCIDACPVGLDITEVLTGLARLK